jgi:PAS domain S-box-containing protein
VANGTIHAISDSIVALDQDERIVFINHAAELMFGVADAEVRGIKIGDLCVFSPSKALSALLPFPIPNDAALPVSWDRRCVIMSTVRGKIPVELIRTPISGANESSAGHVLSIRDISDTFSAQAVKSRLAAIVSNSYDAILSIDPDLLVVSWNLGAERIYGFSSDDMLGKSIQTIAVNDADRNGFQAIVELALSGQDVGRFETRRRTRSGKIITISMSISPIRDPEGNVNEIACIERDVSAEKEYEESLILAKRSAEDLSRAKSGSCRI